MLLGPATQWPNNYNFARHNWDPDHHPVRAKYAYRLIMFARHRTLTEKTITALSPGQACLTVKKSKIKFLRAKFLYAKYL